LFYSAFRNPHPEFGTVVLEDPEDNRILECAIEAKANYVISGDFSLLKLRRYRNIEVVNVAAFLERF
jgi:predicted nucleic acid-binding protein